MADDAARLGAMMRKHLSAAVTNAKVAAESEGKILADLMRSIVPRKQGKLLKSIRVERADIIKLSSGAKGAYARRAGNRSAGSDTNRMANFVGVIVKAGDESTLVAGEKPGKKSGKRRGTEFQNARLQEFGTKDMMANPFFYYSYRLRRSQIKANISRALRKGWLEG